MLASLSEGFSEGASRILHRKAIKDEPMTIRESDPSARETPSLPTINALWIGQLSPLERLCLSSFAAHGHRVHVYTYDAIENVPRGVTLQDAAQILPLLPTKFFAEG